METTISLPEASRLAAVSQTTVRRWIKSGSLEAKQDKAGKWQVNKQHLLSRLAIQPPRQGANMHETLIESSDKDRLLSETMEALSRERRINDELRSENIKLNAEIRGLLEVSSKKNFKGAISRWIKF